VSFIEKLRQTLGNEEKWKKFKVASNLFKKGQLETEEYCLTFCKLFRKKSIDLIPGLLAMVTNKSVRQELKETFQTLLSEWKLAQEQQHRTERRSSHADKEKARGDGSHSKKEGKHAHRHRRSASQDKGSSSHRSRARSASLQNPVHEDLGAPHPLTRVSSDPTGIETRIREHHTTKSTSKQTDSNHSSPAKGSSGDESDSADAPNSDAQAAVEPTDLEGSATNIRHRKRFGSKQASLAAMMAEAATHRRLNGGAGADDSKQEAALRESDSSRFEAPDEPEAASSVLDGSGDGNRETEAVSAETPPLSGKSKSKMRAVQHGMATLMVHAASGSAKKGNRVRTRSANRQKGGTPQKSKVPQERASKSHQRSAAAAGETDSTRPVQVSSTVKAFSEDLFQKLDKDGSGSIEIKEMKFFLRKVQTYVECKPWDR